MNETTREVRCAECRSLLGTLTPAADVIAWPSVRCRAHPDAKLLLETAPDLSQHALLI